MNIGTIVQQFKVGSLSYNKTTQLTGGSSVSREPSIAAAKTGTLSAKTDSDTGTITGQASHGIATGDKISIFWTESGVQGQRRNVTVGTVAGTSIPIDLGSGDNLPSLNSPVTIMKEVAYDFRFDGDDLVALIAGANKQANIILTGDDDVEDFAIVLKDTNEYKYGWPDTAGGANPVVGDVITRARITHADSGAAQTVKVGAAIS